MDLTQIVKDVVLTKVCSIKADKDSTTSKNITLKVKFDGVDLNAVFGKALSSAVIQWQNGPGRTKYDSWASGQVVNVDFRAPAAAPMIDPEVAIIERMKTMTVDERIAYFEELAEKAEGNN